MTHHHPELLVRSSAAPEPCGEAAVPEARAAMLADGFEFAGGWRPGLPFGGYVREREGERHTGVVTEMSVPSTILLGVGGHIAYGVLSDGVIERCGGVLENIVDDLDGGPRKRRYWIE